MVRWAPRLPRLETLELYDGTSLEDELVHTTIHEHCPQFNSLSIFRWAADDRDQKLAKFLSDIRPQSLKALELIGDIGAGPETFLALNEHSKSLTELKICISDDALPHLSLLCGCTAIEVLEIDVDNGTINLEKTQNDVFLETIAWLRQCSSLRRLTFQKFLSAPSLVAPLLLEDNIKLQRLQIPDYIVKDNQLFHQALVHQKHSLKGLTLDGDTEDMLYEDVEILVDALRQLTELRELRLVLLPEVLQDEHLISIINNLPKLEDLYISGLEMKDGVLAPLGNLRNLRSVTFTGVSNVTLDGLFDFIQCLGPGNQGIRVVVSPECFVLQIRFSHHTWYIRIWIKMGERRMYLMNLTNFFKVEMAEPDTLLTDEEVTLVREGLMEKVGGTLETPWKGMYSQWWRGPKNVANER